MSDALALKVVWPPTVEASAGAVRETLGGVVSIVISCVCVVSALPALSKARYLTVVVAGTVNGAR